MKNTLDLEYLYISEAVWEKIKKIRILIYMEIGKIDFWLKWTNETKDIKKFHFICLGF